MSKLIALVVAGTALVLGATCGPAEARQSGPPTSAKEVVERYVAAVGGREAVERLATRTVTGLLVHNLSWHDPQVETLRFVYRAGSRNRYMVEMTGSHGTYREGFDGVSGWRVDEAGLLHAEPDAEYSKYGWYCASPSTSLTRRCTASTPPTAGPATRSGTTGRSPTTPCTSIPRTTCSVPSAGTIRLRTTVKWTA